MYFLWLRRFVLRVSHVSQASSPAIHIKQSGVELPAPSLPPSRRAHELHPLPPHSPWRQPFYSALHSCIIFLLLFSKHCCWLDRSAQGGCAGTFSCMACASLNTYQYHAGVQVTFQPAQLSHAKVRKVAQSQHAELLHNLWLIHSTADVAAHSPVPGRGAASNDMVCMLQH